MQNEAASCGLDSYGFPLIYYDHFEGKCDNCWNNFGFKPKNLAIDIVFALIFGVLISVLVLPKKFNTLTKLNEKNHYNIN